MKIITSYCVDLKNQLFQIENKDNNKANSKNKDKAKAMEPPRIGRIVDSLMRETADVCLKALRYCGDVFLTNWDMLSKFPLTAKKGGFSRRSQAEKLIHSTSMNQAVYPEFDRMFAGMPSYTRRAVIAKALGIVSSYRSNHKNWEKLSPAERGVEPTMGYPSRYGLTFYEQERDLEGIRDGVIRLKLFNGKTWEWYDFLVKKADAQYIGKLMTTRKILSPIVEKVHKKYQIRFSFEESVDLVPERKTLSYRILAVDLGINAPASWCIMTSDGTVHAKGVIHLACDEGRLSRLINRKRQYQQAGKKCKYIYRMVRKANETLSINTSKTLMEVAIAYDVDCIVFEHLDRDGKKGSGRYRERLHMWRANDVQKRVEVQAHRNGMRISRVCAWGTSKLAYDGSGETNRHSVYTYRKGRKWYNYSICTFKSGKVYNCDLSASQNIGARYFLRLYAKAFPNLELSSPPQRTLSTLWEAACTVLQKKAIA